LSSHLTLATKQYYNRWANHEQSAKLSKEVYAKTEKKMEEMQITSELTWIEVQFARKAVDEVERCRMTLKWTYAMAFYLDKGNEKELFEDNQRYEHYKVIGLSHAHKPLYFEMTETWRRRLKICQSF
jgi:ariadne-1